MKIYEINRYVRYNKYYFFVKEVKCSFEEKDVRMIFLASEIKHVCKTLSKFKFTLRIYYFSVLCTLE